MDERTFIFAAEAEQFVDRKQAQTELKDGTYSHFCRDAV